MWALRVLTPLLLAVGLAQCAPAPPPKNVGGASTEQACADRTTLCASWGTQKCAEGQYYKEGDDPWIQRIAINSYWCPATCGKCGCHDKSPECQEWMASYCNDDKFAVMGKPIGSFWCPVTCNRCPSPPSPPSPGPPPSSSRPSPPPARPPPSSSRPSPPPARPGPSTSRPPPPAPRSPPPTSSSPPPPSPSPPPPSPSPPPPAIQTGVASTEQACFDRSQVVCSVTWTENCDSGLVDGLLVGTYWCPDSCGKCGCYDKTPLCGKVHCSQIFKGKPFSYWCPESCKRCPAPPPPPPSPSPPPPSPSPPPPAIQTWQSHLLKLVNDERAKVGLLPLCLNHLLNAAAQAHSQDMATRRTVTRTSSDGSTPGERLARQGYEWTAWTESVAGGPTSAQEVFNSWWRSPLDKAYILSKSFRHMGVGRAGSDRQYWTLDFGNSDSQGCA